MTNVAFLRIDAEVMREARANNATLCEWLMSAAFITAVERDWALDQSKVNQKEVVMGKTPKRCG